MSFKSRSYSRVNEEFEAQSERFKNEVSYLPIRSDKEDRLTQLNYLEKHTTGLQSVFRAEFIKISTKEQIKNHLANLKIALEEASPNQIFKISCHPQSDATTKSAHFHLWGDVTPEMEKVFEQYLINNKLTIQDKVNITAIAKGEIKEVIYNEITKKEEFRKITDESRRYKVKDKTNTNNYDLGDLFEETKNLKILTPQKATKSVIIEANELKVEKEEDTYIKQIDKKLKENLKIADEKVMKMLKSREFEEFEAKFEKTFENLNTNLDEFLTENKNKMKDLEERIKKSLELKDI